MLVLDRKAKRSDHLMKYANWVSFTIHSIGLPFNNFSFFSSQRLKKSNKKSFSAAVSDAPLETQRMSSFAAGIGGLLRNGRGAISIRFHCAVLTVNTDDANNEICDKESISAKCSPCSSDHEWRWKWREEKWEGKKEEWEKTRKQSSKDSFCYSIRFYSHMDTIQWLELLFSVEEYMHCTQSCIKKTLSLKKKKLYPSNLWSVKFNTSRNVWI